MGKGPLESELQRRIIKQMEARGWLVQRNAVTTKQGWPDLTVFKPEGRCLFIEVKRKGEKPTEIQKYRHEQLRRLGYDVAVIDEELLDRLDMKVELFNRKDEGFSTTDF